MARVALYAVEFGLSAFVIVLLFSQLIVPIIFRQPIFPLFRSEVRDHEREMVRLEAERARAVGDIEKARLQKEIDRLRAAMSAPPPPTNRP